MSRFWSLASEHSAGALAALLFGCLGDGEWVTLCAVRVAVDSAKFDGGNVVEVVDLTTMVWVR